MRRVLAPIVALSFATALLFVQAGQVTGAASAESQLARALPYAAPSAPPGTNAATVIVPDLRGLSEMDAVNALLTAGLQPGSRAEMHSDRVPAGMVIDTLPMAGTEVESGSVVDYVVSTAPSVSSTPEPTSEPTPAPSPEPTGTPGPMPSVQIVIGSSSTVHWDAYFERIQAFLGTFYPATMAWSAALEDRDFEQAATLAATMRQASLDLFAWLDDNPPDPCYLASWQAFHHGTELLAAAMDAFTTEGLDAAAEQFIPAGSALAEAGATIQDAGGACRTWVGDTDCSTWLEDSIPITGDTSRFTLQASSNWRRLEPGDPGWVTLFGAHGSAVEQQVADGTIGDFIVPVEPPDADRTVNLAVYVLQASADDTPATLADHHAAYLRTLGRFLEVADRGELALPAGHAARVTAVRTELPGEAPKRDVLDTYLLIHGGRTYYLEFISSEATADRYGGEFGCMMASLRWMPAASSSEPDRQTLLPSRSPTASTTILEARAGHTATLLPDGRVLIVGGLHDLEQNLDSALATAELWDPATGTSSPAGTLADGRSYHTATLLQDGRVLIAGGGLATLELWDPRPSRSVRPGRCRPALCSGTRPRSCPTVASSSWADTTRATRRSGIRQPTCSARLVGCCTIALVTPRPSWRMGGS